MSNVLLPEKGSVCFASCGRLSKRSRGGTGGAGENEGREFRDFPFPFSFLREREIAVRCLPGLAGRFLTSFLLFVHRLTT